MDGQSLALVVTILTHLLGAAFLVAMLIRMDGAGPGDIRRGWWDDEEPEGPSSDGPEGPLPGRELPLPEAGQSSVRRRGDEERTRLRPKPARRPEHAPAEPGRVPERAA